MTNKYKMCYETHPALSVAGFEVYGGSCSRPVVQDADVYVGFDMSARRTQAQYPWSGKSEFLFYIPDMGVPSNVEDFKALIQWLSVQLAANKKVHLGCIGGHGRTGTVLAALYASMAGGKDAISYVREHYCKRAVESKAQVDFLVTHFGVNPEPPAKEEFRSAPKYAAHSHTGNHSTKRWEESKAINPSGVLNSNPVPSSIGIWGDYAKLGKQKNLL